MHDVNEDYDKMIRAQRSQADDKEKKHGSSISNEDDLENMTEEDLEFLKIKEMKKLQNDFREKAKAKIMKVCKEALSMVDAACDEIGKRFLSDPPKHQLKSTRVKPTPKAPKTRPQATSHVRHWTNSQRDEHSDDRCRARAQMDA